MDLPHDPTAVGFCGDAPFDRTTHTNTANGEHGLCLECFYPTPVGMLVDDRCAECRGEPRSWAPDTTAPSREDYL